MLRSLPEVTRLFTAGELSWGQVRRITAAARRVPIAQRGLLDARIAATCARDGGLDAYSPDDLCDQAAAAAEELRQPRGRERAEERKARGEFLTLQSDLEGGLAGYFNLGPVSGAIFLNALTAQLSRLDQVVGDEGTAPGDPGSASDPDVAGEDPPAVGAWTGRDRSRRQARALLAMPAATLAGVFGDGRPRPARALVTCIIDLRQATRSAAGTVVLDVPGPLPSMTARLAEQLSGDATLQAVPFDGHRPPAVARKLHAEDLPADVRTAVTARDRGSRFPASRMPAGRCHAHHLQHREHGGTHDVDNLALVGPHEHLTGVHQRGWQGRLDPSTGIITWTRRGRSLRTHPRGTPLAQPDHDPPDDRAGTGPPVDPSDTRAPHGRSPTTPPGADHPPDDGPLPF